jgi:alpha-tubulin suppressor-like RCC1 family protein
VVGPGVAALLAMACGSDSLGEPGPEPPDRTAAVVELNEGVGLVVPEGGQHALTARAYDSNSRELTGITFGWNTLDPGIASINASGIAHGLTPGSARIVVTAGTAADTGSLTVAVTWNAVTTAQWSVFSCARLADNRAFCWGANEVGQLGDGTTSNRTVPTAVAGDLRFVQLTAGGVHVCGLTDTGAAYCWGLNGEGQLGDGTRENRLVPTPVSSPTPFVALDAGHNFTCGLTAAGRPFCWGANDIRQLGLPSTGTGDRRLTPTEVTGSPDLARLSLGILHACGITAAGAGWCWGWNEYDQLGNGHGTASEGPTAVQGGFLFDEMSSGYIATCGGSAAGAVYCWGGQYGGRLAGNPSAIPTPIAGGVSLHGLSSGASHWCGIGDTQSYCWGSNGSGQLGNGTTTASATPVAVNSQTALAQIAPAKDHTCAVSVERVLYCWGVGIAIGNGLTLPQPSPTLVRNP